MLKRALRSTMIFLGIISIFALCYLIYGVLAQNSWRILPVGDGQAIAVTWLDGNTNGIKDANEKYLPHVCIWSSYSLLGGAVESNQCEYSYADDQGRWGEFLPGGSCDEVFVFAQSPSGFHPTTNLVSNGCDAKFGFVQDNVPISHKVLSIDEYIQQQNRSTVLMRIVIGLIITVVGILGTVWLEKKPNEGK